MWGLNPRPTDKYRPACDNVINYNTQNKLHKLTLQIFSTYVVSA